MHEIGTRHALLMLHTDIYQGGETQRFDSAPEVSKSEDQRSTGHRMITQGTEPLIDVARASRPCGEVGHLLRECTNLPIHFCGRRDIRTIKPKDY